MVSPLRPLIFASLLFAAASSAHAQIEFNITSGPDNSAEEWPNGSGVSANIWFDYHLPTQTVLIRVTNTSNVTGAGSGVLTSFGFTIPNDVVVEAFYTTSLLQLVNPYQMTPDSTYGLDPQGLGAGTQGKVDGNHHNGIAPGQQFWFYFDLKDGPAAGDSLAGILTAWDFFQLNNSIGDTSGADFVLRYQSVNGDGSDKVFWNDTMPLLPIPEPSTYGMIGAGALLGLAAWRRRRRA